MFSILARTLNFQGSKFANISKNKVLANIFESTVSSPQNRKGMINMRGWAADIPLCFFTYAKNSFSQAASQLEDTFYQFLITPNIVSTCTYYTPGIRSI